MSARCPRCRRGRGANRTVCMRCERHDKVTAGLAVVRNGGRYDDAAEAAGYSDGFTFSRACVDAFGARPRDLVRP